MKISLITVTHNSALTLTDTIESVLAQTHDDIEYIIVDGFSKDSTVDIIKEYEKQFSDNFKWISEEDSGLYDAMNKGIRMATGDIIGTINSDDFFSSTNVLSSVVDEFKKGNMDGIYGDVCFVKANDVGKRIRYYSSRIFTNKLMKIGLMPAHPTFYVKRECFEKFGMYKTSYRICADFDLLLRFIYVNDIKTKYIPMNMVTMRLGGVSTNGIRSRIQIMKEHLRILKDNKVKSNALLLSMRYLYKLTEYFRKSE